MALLARLFGDVATITYPARMEGCTLQPETEIDGQESLCRLLKQSFGKIVEAEAPAESSLQQQARASTGLCCLQLSLEEAFYLKYVDETLALAFADPIPVPASPYCREHEKNRQYPTEEEEPTGGGNAGHTTLGSFGSDDHPSTCIGEAACLSDEQAWGYCCARRRDFLATFAVYRHFRSKGYVVHTGHKYGAHFVLYEGSPDECHSRYCVHVMGGGGGDSWGHLSTMTRLMPDIAKCLLVCGVSYNSDDDDMTQKGDHHAETCGTSFLLDPTSLEALRGVEVTTLSFSRASNTEGGGSRGPSVSDTGRGASGSSRGNRGKSAKKKGKIPDLSGMSSSIEARRVG